MKQARKSKVLTTLGLCLSMCMLLVACGGEKDLPLTQTIDTVISDKDYDEERVKASITEFGLRLLEENLQVSEQEENVLISPISVVSALGMTTYGANGKTLTQMEAVFGLGRGHLNHFNSQYLRENSDELKIANSIWFTNDDCLTVKEEFLQFNKEFYGVDIYETAFNDATVKDINQWVEKNTDGTIKEILDEIPLDAVMYLINALVFEAEWEEKYDSTQIWENGSFTSSSGENQTVNMMRSEEDYYLEDANAKGFIKYYKDKKYAFVAMLPKAELSVADYVKSLTGEELQNLLENPEEVTVNVHIPEFSYEYDIEMSDLFKKMGMTDAFDGNEADFTSMATSTKGNIFINRVLHKTFIEVTPVGTKAGAATVVEMKCESAPFYVDVKEVFLDRPFFYMIIDCENNLPIFVGTVNEIE